MTYNSKAAMKAEFATNFPANTTGLITPAVLTSTMNDVADSYDQNPNVNAQVGTSYAFVTGDNGQLVTFNNTASIAVTLSVASAAGFNPWNVNVANLGAGVVTITPTTSTIGGNASVTLAKNQTIKIVSDGANYQIVRTTVLPGAIAFTVSGINFNSANTDNPFPLALPPGYSNFLINAVYLSGASHTLVTATAGVFTAAAGGGTAIVTGGSAISVSGTTSGAAASAQSFTVIGALTVMWSLAAVPILFFRVANAEGVAATGTVTIVIIPVS